MRIPPVVGRSVFAFRKDAPPSPAPSGVGGNNDGCGLPTCGLELLPPNRIPGVLNPPPPPSAPPLVIEFARVGTGSLAFLLFFGEEICGRWKCVRVDAAVRRDLCCAAT